MHHFEQITPPTPYPLPPLQPEALEDRLRAAMELKDVSLELLTSNYSAWLETYFQPCCAVVRKVEPQFQSNLQHQLRYAVLELLNRLPQNEVFKPHAASLFQLCLGVVRADNQDNALIANKIMFDMLKTYKAQLEPQAEKFMELVLQVSVMYMQQALASFRCSRLPPASCAARSADLSSKLPRVLLSPSIL